MKRATLVWLVLALALSAPLIAAAFSPYLAYRSPVYIFASFAGIIAMGLLLAQPLLATGFLPGLTRARSKRLHGFVGAALTLAVLGHVIGLYFSSPPDVIDALTFMSPTPFSHWGVIAMWAVFIAAALALLRHRLKWRVRTWRSVHLALVWTIAIGTGLHAILIEGTMEPITKFMLLVLVLNATAFATFRVLRKGH